MPAPADPAPSPPTVERSAALALLPVAATIDYYALPAWLQNQPLVQFAPQLIGYLAFALWASHNSSIVSRIGLPRSQWRQGLRLGAVTGTILGCVNSLVILHLVPYLGRDITFLRDTPHARVPVEIKVSRLRTRYLGINEFLTALLSLPHPIRSSLFCGWC